MMLRTVSLNELRTCDVTFSLGCLTNHLSAQLPYKSVPMMLSFRFCSQIAVRILICSY